MEIVLPHGRRYILHRAILSMNSKFFRRTLIDESAAANGPAEKKGQKRMKGEEPHNVEESCIKYRFHINGKGQDAILALQVCFLM